MFFRHLSLTCFLFAPALAAQTISISAADLTAALDAEQGSPSGALESRLTEEFQHLGVSLREGALLSETSLRDVELSAGCTRTSSLRSLDVETILGESTGFSFEISSLQKPIELAVRLDLQILGEGRVDQEFGGKVFGRCVNYASDDFTFDIEGGLILDLQFALVLNPRVIDEVTVRLNPEIRIVGELEYFEHQIQVRDTLLDGTIEKELRKALEERLSDAKLEEHIASMEDKVREEMAERWEGGFIDITVAGLEGELVGEPYSGFDSLLPFPLAVDFFNGSRAEILLAILSGDTADIKEAAVFAAG